MSTKNKVNRGGYRGRGKSQKSQNNRQITADIITPEIPEIDEVVDRSVPIETSNVSESISSAAVKVEGKKDDGTSSGAAVPKSSWVPHDDDLSFPLEQMC